MPFTLVGWSASADQAALVALPVIPDPHLTVQGNDIRVPAFANKLIGVYVNGVNLTRAQLQSPSLRTVLNYEIAPLDRGALPATPAIWRPLMDDEIDLLEDESINLLTSEDGAGATRMNGFIWLGSEVPAVVNGPTFTMRVSAAVTLTAFGWTNAALTFDQTLPPGEYAIVGAQFRSTNLIAFRFVLPGAFHRPGGIGSAAVSALVPPGQRMGGWGEWGRFRHTTPPTVDFFAGAADAAETGELDLMKTG